MDLDLTRPESPVFHTLAPVWRMDLSRACIGIYDPYVGHAEGEIFADLGQHFNSRVAGGKDLRRGTAAQ